jgi:hypothetical protein
MAPTLEAALTPADARWLESIGWSDAKVPPVETAADAERYARIEKQIAHAIAPLSFAERSDSLEGRLAAELGARLADWREAADDDKD